MKLRNALVSWPRPVRLGFVLGLTVVIGWLDHLTGSEFSFSIFYLLPVGCAAWYAGRREVAAVSLAATACWLGAILWGDKPFTHLVTPFWNAAVQLAFFATVGYMLVRLSESRQRQQELSQFVVHDLRTPLTNVLSGFETLKALAADRLEPVELEIVEMGVSSGNRMLSLINTLLDLAKAETTGLKVELDSREVADMLNDAVRQVSTWASENEVTLESGVQPDAERAYCDRLMTVRVLVNLLGNAIKFSPSGSVVTVSAKVHTKGRLVFGIADRGPGIPKQWAKKVFDKFGQVDARKAGVSGTGLGLTFCRLAVEAQGGEIWLESEVGVGTTVYFTLPTVPQASHDDGH